MPQQQPTLAVVGATGSVGTVMRELLTSRRNVWGEIRMIASARSAGKELDCRGEKLVVREVNRDAMRRRPRGIISNANCTTMAMIMAIAPLHHEYGLRELVLASYQAVSGAGQIGVDILHDQLTKVAGDRALGSRPGNVRQAVGDDLGPFPAPLALNVVPWSGSLDAEGARGVLRNAPGVILVDDPAAGEFPMPIDAVGTDPSWVGRIRRAMDDPRALDLFITGDNMRKGAALNTVQIAELLAAEFTKN